MSPLRLKAGNKFKMPVANAADGLVTQCKQVGIVEPAREFVFHPVRRWRFDLAWPSFGKIAVEVDGGVWISGRHSRGAGIEADCEKFAEAICLGWRVLRVTPRQIQNGQAVKWIERAMGVRTAEFECRCGDIFQSAMQYIDHLQMIHDGKLG